MSVAQTIEKKLREALNPARLEVRNDSDRHIGHAGHDGSGESHFHVLIVSERFIGLGRVARHRLINDILFSELRNQIHALSIGAYAPDELKANKDV